MYLDTCTDMAGGQYSLLTLLKRLDRSKYVPLLFSPAGSRLADLCREMGIETRILPFRSLHLGSRRKTALFGWAADLVRSIAGFSFLVWSVRRKHVDVVHANTFKAALIASIACRLAGRPLVFHDRIAHGHGYLGKIVARLAKKIIVVSSSLAAKHGVALRGKVALIYDGIDTDYMSPGKVRPEAAEEDLRGSVCYLGRISWEKGVDRFVEAARLVAERVPGTRFLVGGSPHIPEDNTYYEKLQRLVEDLNLSPLLHFTGHIEDARAFIIKAQVVVLPSRRESLGLVLLEAMSLEKPVVAFDIEGPQEIITDRKDGLLVGPDDVQGLAEAVVSLLKDPDLRRQLGKLGRETVISRFSAKTFAERISRIYDEIAGASVPAEANDG